MKIDLNQPINTGQPGQNTTLRATLMSALETSNAQVCDPDRAKDLHARIKAHKDGKFDLALDDLPTARSCVKATCFNKVIWQVDDILDPPDKKGK